MAINAAAQWWIRVSGNELNGGGYDSTISGATTNYADQDSSQLNITDGATSGANSTTLTSAAAGFTSAMVGNCIRIASGTNFQTGYYFITVYTNTTTVTLDHTPTSGGAGSGGTGRIGGAFASLLSLANGGTATQPVLTTPLAPGHTVNIRGAGTSDPTSADYTITGYYTYPNGDNTTGIVQFKGYNGRPLIVAKIVSLTSGYMLWNHCKFKYQDATYQHGLIDASGTATPVYVYDCIFDQNGNDARGVRTSGGVVDCWFKNSGGGSAGSYAAIAMDAYGYNNYVQGCYIDGWLGDGISCGYMGSISFTVIVNCLRNGINIATNATTWSHRITNCTIHGNTGAGVKLAASADMLATTIRNSIMTANGTYGLDLNANSAAVNDLLRMRDMLDNNNFGTGGSANTTAAIHNGSVSSSDVALDPQFTNSAGGDFSVGANMKAIGKPGVFNGTTTGYLDCGAVQRPEPAAGGLGARAVIIQAAGSF